MQHESMVKATPGYLRLPPLTSCSSIGATGEAKAPAHERMIRMKKFIRKRLNVGDKATWTGPYGFETVTISEVEFDNRQNEYRYKTKEYPFWIFDRDL